jgi:alanine racemase/UDP-N-acetylmuramoyl-tripeptide--D-alanyl-D-alanine ligase
MDRFDLREWPGFREAGGTIAEPAFVDHIVLDSRRIESPQTLFVALPGKNFDGHHFVEKADQSGVRFALVQKGWSFPTPLSLQLLRVDNPLAALQQIAEAYRASLSVKTVAITGSYGKTMLKDLLFALTSTAKKSVASPESFNSQIGVALSLLKISRQDEVAIIEAGISQKYEMEHLAQMIRPTCGILTNIGDAHLSTLGSLKQTAEEKLKLFKNSPKMEWVLIPYDPHVAPWMDQLGVQPHFWSDPTPQLPYAASIPASPHSKMPYEIVFPSGRKYIAEMSGGFSYFLDMVNMAIKAAWLLGVSEEKIYQVLRSYTPEPMQTETWKAPTGTLFINDSYCSDPLSVDIALKHFQHAPSVSRKIFAFGGMRSSKGVSKNDYRRIGQAIGRTHLDTLMLYGQHDFNPLIEEVNKESDKTEIVICSHYHELLSQMGTKLHPEDVVLIKGAHKEPLELLTATFNESISNNQCLVNQAAIRFNIETIRKKLAPDTRVMVLVKAFAYGTDDVRMSKFLESCGVDLLGVSYTDEGVSLKRAGVNQSIFVINAAPYEAAKVVKWGLEVGISSADMIEALQCEAAKAGKKVVVHLHIDTGMSRFGCRPEEALSLAKQIQNAPNLILEGAMTHFACADNPEEDGFTLAQAKHFEQTLNEIERHGIPLKWKHASNSAAVMRFDFPQFNMVRIGLAVYGLNPSPACTNSLKLRLALALTSRIVGINHCKLGETISYGRSYTVNRPNQTIAVLPIGYFDGLHRNYSGKGEVIVRGKKARMVGKICMDFMMIDITDIPDVQIGDTVLIFGKDEFGHFLSPEDLAGRGDSIVYELITCLGPRIQRVFVNE